MIAAALSGLASTVGDVGHGGYMEASNVQRLARLAVRLGEAACEEM